MRFSSLFLSPSPSFRPHHSRSAPVPGGSIACPMNNNQQKRVLFVISLHIFLNNLAFPNIKCKFALNISTNNN